MQEVTSPKDIELDKIGMLDAENKFFFRNVNEINKLHHHFRLFISRKAISAKSAYFKRAPSPFEEFSFKPEINAKSDLMAYSNLLGDKNLQSKENLKEGLHSMSHPELLLKKGREYKEKVLQKKKEIEMHSMKECTFWPVTNNSTRYIQGKELNLCLSLGDSSFNDDLKNAQNIVHHFEFPGSWFAKQPQL